MSLRYSNFRSPLKLVRPTTDFSGSDKMSSSDFPVRDLGTVPNEFCKCGAKIRLTVDRNGHYNFCCGQNCGHAEASNADLLGFYGR